MTLTRGPRPYDVSEFTYEPGAPHIWGSGPYEGEHTTCGGVGLTRESVPHEGERTTQMLSKFTHELRASHMWGSGPYEGEQTT